MKRLILTAGLLLFGFSGVAIAVDEAEEEREHDGVLLPRHVEVGGTELGLNGAGTRRAFFRNFYVGALYLPEPMNDAGQIMGIHPPHRIALHFIRDVSESRMRDAIQDGFEDNTDAEELEELEDKIAQFRELISAPRERDRFYFDYDPERGTIVSINDEEQGVIEGASFNLAVMRIFIGENPADDDLRDGMLGLTDME